VPSSRRPPTAARRQEVRTALASDKAGDPAYEQAYQEMMAARLAAIEQARQMIARKTAKRSPMVPGGRRVNPAIAYRGRRGRGVSTAAAVA
jgi:hypothetical protein